MNNSHQYKSHKAEHKHRGNGRYFSQKGFQDREGELSGESCEADTGGSRGTTAVERYGLHHGADQDRRSAGRKMNKFWSRETHRVPSFDAAESSNHSSKDRHPPGLKGKEIGLWYAQRNKRKVDKEEKNTSTVSFDKEREMRIRQLLNRLQNSDTNSSPCDNSPTLNQNSASCSKENFKSTYSHTSSDNYIPLSSKSEGVLHSSVRDKEKQLQKDFNVYIPPSTSASTTYFYPADCDESEGKMEKDEPPDCWEDDSDLELVGVDLKSGDNKIVTIDDDDDDAIEDEIIIEDAEAVVEEDVAVIEDTEAVNEVIIIDDDDVVMVDDDEENQLVSVTGVVEYMRAHGDYPYISEEPEADFLVAVPESTNPKLDLELKQALEKRSQDEKYTEMIEFRKKLPAYNMRETIVNAVNSNQVLVISGETGCGKTTQVPQFILDDFISRGMGSQCRIICTQPRRISAISVAERVAAERCEKVGKSSQSSVGYQIRLEAKCPRSQGSILFCTTGIVLKFLEGDGRLNRATHVVIDEIHERDLQSDFLMIILKDLLPLRPDLKVILMSATLNAEMFSQYFNNCNMLNIPGFTFPVKEYLLEDTIELSRYVLDTQKKTCRKKSWPRKSSEQKEEETNYAVWCRNLQGSYNPQTINVLQNFDFTKVDIELIDHLINYICSYMEDGAILVFVPGWEDIKKLHELIQKKPRCKTSSFRVIPLHSLMPTVNQREVFERPPPGVRKIVIATNIAETSITIDDVVFVIDCGKIKVKDFKPEMNLTSLEPKWVSRANAKQRKGRAGRVQAGHCFHLFTQFHFNLLQDYLPAEMLRTRLEELCLQIKLLKLGKIVPFISKAMQHPSMESIEHAVETLIQLNALDAAENLLPLGYHLARMPVEPHTGKMILFGAMFCCLDPILTVAASLSFKDAFTIPLGKEHIADQIRVKLAAESKSDHIMLINAFKGWEESLTHGNNRNYCWENFLSENTLKMLRDMKKQLAELLYDIGFVGSKDPKHPQANVNSGNLGLIRAVLCAGLYPNVAQVCKVPGQKSGKFMSVGMKIKDGSKVQAHPKSVNMKQSFFESKWMVFYHKLKTTKIYIHDSTMVSPYPLLFFGGEIKITKENGIELISVDDWVKFKASSSTAHMVKDLRQQLDKLLTKKITTPGPTCWKMSDPEGALMSAIADLITMEDRGYTIRGQSMGGSIGKHPGK
ncbi:ATP-dependent DNA/RNA helicase DHX36-like [Physella acuta]|uniref:ATP-dependent DNA/RNA helicase DHX36-like n=1 Tax=Physella acuta TaxID=109671 RepID=UPI0027DE7A0F|nr:ATP-dependent DNA/RNA helicase DHX36-like [Physella acuta]